MTDAHVNAGTVREQARALEVANADRAELANQVARLRERVAVLTDAIVGHREWKTAAIVPAPDPGHVDLELWEVLDHDTVLGS